MKLEISSGNEILIEGHPVYFCDKNGNNMMGRIVEPSKKKMMLPFKFPEIPDKCLRHFIRGVIDGDGTVRYVKRDRSPYFEIMISSGSKTFIDEVAKKIALKTGVFANTRKIAKNTYLLRYNMQKRFKSGQVDLRLWLPLSE